MLFRRFRASFFFFRHYFHDYAAIAMPPFSLPMLLSFFRLRRAVIDVSLYFHAIYCCRCRRCLLDTLFAAFFHGQLHFATLSLMIFFADDDVSPLMAAAAISRRY